MRTRFAALQDRSLRLDDDAVNVVDPLAQVLRDAGERTAGARAGDPPVDTSFHLLEDLRACRFVVRFRVENIAELLRYIGVRNGSRELLSPCDGTLHSGVLRRQLHPPP